VRYVMLVSGLISLIAAGVLWRARRHLATELDRYG
jgi:hypothetical protein